MIRAIIVDDEPLAREKVQLFAQSIPDLQIVDVCSNGHEALTSLKKTKPDLVFLDIQMPELTGFDILEKIKKEKLPGIIFITAYDEFALRAFEFHALDYLLKPFDRERFEKAVERAKEIVSSEQNSDVTSQQIRSLLDSLKKETQTLERIIVKTNGRIIFLRVDEIDWMEAAGNYIKLHVGNEAHLVRETMNNIEKQLNREKFVRIHRSTIVNIDRLKELQPWFNDFLFQIFQSPLQHNHLRMKHTVE
ncbi:MAG: response regulator transcription factor [Ignavibacteriales bacterium]|nr:response regulator transcription factor [Ignavibacteriales bacterium]